MSTPNISHDYSHAAAVAARSVVRHFGRRAFGIPGTLIGAVQVPDNRTRVQRFAHWHYWWQAHFLDCAVDAGFRRLREGNTESAQAWLGKAQEIQRGIVTRNFGTVINDFYDDMAWLTLALGRLNALHRALHGVGSISTQDAGVTLYNQLTDAIDDSLGGGVFWSKKRDFKNTPATAPTALALVRAHRGDEAAPLLNWLGENLWDDDNSAYLDGIRITGTNESGAFDTAVERALYSYNSGPVLSALLELEPTDDLPLWRYRTEHAADIIGGVAHHFTCDFNDDGTAIRVLTTKGSGDGGLFTGILARNLADTSTNPELDAASRATARELVLNTARILWEGRREFDPDLPLNEFGIDVNEIRGESIALFSPDVTAHTSESLVPGRAVELSSQLQAWMILEAAARIA